MGEKLTNRQALSLMLKYMGEADEAAQMADYDFKKFVNNSVFYNAISMALLSIGELAAQLSEELKADTERHIPWPFIVGMRNHFAHGYWVMDPIEIWDTYREDIPDLRQTVQKLVTSDSMYLDAPANGRTKK